MSIEKLEAEALKQDSKSRARLAATLLRSLEELSESEVAQLWADEANRRDADPSSELPAEHVLREASSSFA